jgi:hypothetical protein
LSKFRRHVRVLDDEELLLVVGCRHFRETERPRVISLLELER